MEDGFAVSPRQHGQCGETLLGHVHALDRLELLEKDRDGVDDDGRGARQGLHHVRERATRVGHYHEVVLDAEEIDERGDDLLDRETRQSVLVTHDEYLAHADDGLELFALVVDRLQPGKQLLGFRG